MSVTGNKGPVGQICIQYFICVDSTISLAQPVCSRIGSYSIVSSLPAVYTVPDEVTGCRVETMEGSEHLQAESAFCVPDCMDHM
jgi:hypothetical protein